MASFGALARSILGLIKTRAPGLINEEIPPKFSKQLSTAFCTSLILYELHFDMLTDVILLPSNFLVMNLNQKLTTKFVICIFNSGMTSCYPLTALKIIILVIYGCPYL